MPWTWSLPNTVKSLLEQERSKTEHLGLLLDKFSPSLADDKKQWLTEAAIDRPRFDRTLARAQRARWGEVVLHQEFAVLLEMVTTARLIVGLGAEHILETAITLDRNSGLPLIPGSAVKGLARTAALIDLAGSLPSRLEDRTHALNALDKTLSQEIATPESLAGVMQSDAEQVTHEHLADAHRFQDCFGRVDEAGKVVFLDGIYAGDAAPKYEVDVMTPHFSAYYVGAKQAPADDLKLIPVPYLTVAAGQLFWFATLPRHAEHGDFAKYAARWLRTGLTEYGIGAKTNQGYGLFKQQKG